MRILPFTVLSSVIIRISDSACTTNAFGWSCQHPCNCNGTCNSTGYCNGKCYKPWDGPTCQKYNVALNKSATQSDFYYPEIGFPATNAVDGDTTGDMFNGSCIHTTEHSSSNGWWRVDLDDVVSIKSVRIYDRTDSKSNKQSLANFSIIVSNNTNELLSGTICYKRITPIPENTADRIYDHKCVATGRYVTVSIPGRILTFCEIEVYACVNGTFGDECEHQCGHCSYSSVCNPNDGKCPVGCDAGWRGKNCIKVCMKGTFGDECQHQCGHCDNNSACNRVDGKCPAGCDAGWRGNNCNQPNITSSYYTTEIKTSTEETSGTSNYGNNALIIMLVVGLVLLAITSIVFVVLYVKLRYKLNKYKQSVIENKKTHRLKPAAKAKAPEKDIHDLERSAGDKAEADLYEDEIQNTDAQQYEDLNITEGQKRNSNVYETLKDNDGVRSVYEDINHKKTT